MNTKSGQSLIEVLIGAAVTVLLIGGAVALMSVSLRVGKENRNFQAATLLSEASINTAAVIIEGFWPTGYQFAVNPGVPGGYFSTDIQSYANCNACLGNNPPSTCTSCASSDVSGLCIANGNQCVLTTASCDGTSFTPQQLSRFYKVALDGTDYYLCHKVEKVFRAGDAIAPSGIEDPATLKILTKVRWGDQGQYESLPLTAYFTRHGNEVFHQTDWSGGSGQNGAWLIRNKFGTSNNVVTSVPGEITVVP